MLKFLVIIMALFFNCLDAALSKGKGGRTPSGKIVPKPKNQAKAKAKNYADSDDEKFDI
jgi:hypothetical protein